MLSCQSVSFFSYGTSGKPIYQKGDKEDKQETSVSHDTAKEISMDAAFVAVISKLLSIFFAYLKLAFPKISMELQSAKWLPPNWLPDTDWSTPT